MAEEVNEGLDLFGEDPSPSPSENEKPPQPDPEAERQRLYAELSRPSGPAHQISAERVNLLLQGLNDFALLHQVVPELNEYLALSTEQSLATFRTKDFLTGMNQVFLCGDYDLILLGVRSLSNLLEALPASAAFFAREKELITSLWTTLASLEDMDVTEACVVVLKKISDSQPVAVFQGGSITVLFGILDFFGLGTQRQICCILSNIVAQLPPEGWDQIQELLPTLANLVTYHDKKVAEEVLMTILMIAQYKLHEPDQLNSIFSYSLLNSLQEVIAGYDRENSISETSFCSALKILTMLCQVNVSLMEQLLDQGICDTLSVLLNNATGLAKCKSSEHTLEILTLLNEFLPSLPATVNMFFEQTNPPSRYAPFGGLSHSASASKGGDLRETFYATSPHRLGVFDKCGFLTVLVNIFESAASSPLKSKVLHTITKIIHFCPDALQSLLGQTSFSYPSFLAKLLSQKELGMVGSAVYLAQLSMEKLPNVFHPIFLREGVVDAMKSLANSTAPSLVSPLKSTPSTPLSGLKRRPSTGPSSSSDFQGFTFHSTSEEPLLREPIKKNEPTPKKTPIRRTSKGARKTQASSPNAPSVDIKVTTPETPAETSPQEPATQNDLFAEMLEKVKEKGLASDTVTLLDEVQPPQTPVKTPKDELRDWVTTHVHDFMSKYFPSSNEETDQLIQLKKLSSKLVEFTKHEGLITKPLEQEMREVLTDLAGLFVRGISSFEYQRSGCTPHFLAFLTELPSSSKPTDFKNRKKRIQLFIEHFLSSSHPSSSGFIEVVHLLHKMLGTDEDFPTLLTSPTSPGAGLKLLLQPFRIDIERDPSEEKLFPYNNPAIMVEPLATIRNLENFLLLRVTKKPKVESTATKTASTKAPKKVKAASATPSSSLENSAEPSSDPSPIADAVIETPSTKTEEDALVPPTPIGVEISPPTLLDNSAPISDLITPVVESKLDESVSASGSRSEEEPQEEPQQDQDDIGDDPDQLMDRLQQIATRTEDTTEKEVPKNDNYISIEPGQKLCFMLNGRVLSSDLFALQIAQQVNFEGVSTEDQERVMLSSSTPSSLGDLWQLPIKLTYKLSTPETQDRSSLTFMSELDRALHQIPSFSSFNSNARQLMSFLWVLHQIYSRSSKLLPFHVIEKSKDDDLFINRNAVSKLTTSLEDPFILCSGALPEWCADTLKNAQFLYPYEVRSLAFASTAFDVSRALHRHLASVDSPESQILSRIPRQKFRIDRSKVLPSAIKIMDKSYRSKSFLLIEYLNEEGVGLGPTKEFFTLVSQEIQRKSLNLWVDHHIASKEEFLFNKTGLFPVALPLYETTPKDYTQLLKHFEFLGRFCAKALMDEKLLDIPFSVPFYKLMVGQPLSVEDIKDIEPDIGNVLHHIHKFCKKKREVMQSSLDDQEKQKQIAELKCMRGSIDDMGLNFTFNGLPLKEKGEDIDVTLENVDEYLALAKNYFIGDGISRQLSAFKKGFNDIFPISHLLKFSAKEIDLLLCGACQHTVSWTKDDILQGLSIQTGYSQNGRAIQFLLQTMTEFTMEQRRRFLSWVTGSPRLPLGGFKALQTKISVYRKVAPEGTVDTDNDLPSVVACFAKLNLPDYSTQQIMLDRILFSMGTGTGKYTLT